MCLEYLIKPKIILIDKVNWNEIHVGKLTPYMSIASKAGCPGVAPRKMFINTPFALVENVQFFENLRFKEAKNSDCWGFFQENFES